MAFLCGDLLAFQRTIHRVESFLHRNGAGVIVGTASAIGDDCFLSRDSILEGASFVSYASRITKSAIKDSHISFANISESAVMGSHIAGAIVRSSGLESVVIRGTKARTANVQNCLLSNKVVIEGCQVRGFELAGPFLVHIDWNRAPRHYLLDIAPGVQLGISECRPGYSHVGCKCRKISHWIEHKEMLRRYFTRNQNWQGDEVDIIHELFKEWRSVRLAA